MRTTGKLRVVQVGCGGRAQAHIAAMQACGAVELLALCDLDEQRSERGRREVRHRAALPRHGRGYSRRAARAGGYRDAADHSRVDRRAGDRGRRAGAADREAAGADALRVAPAGRAGPRPADRREHAVPVDAALAALLWPAGCSARWARCSCCAPARAAICWSKGRTSSTWR